MFKKTLGVVFVLLALGFLVIAISELRVWIYGDRIDAEIVNLTKKGDDEYLLLYKSEELPCIQDSIYLSRKAYNHLKDQKEFNLIALSCQKSDVIYLDLSSRNNIIGLALGVFMFGLAGFKTFTSK